ncbi:MAG: RnfH family protein [Solimonas sp.]
MARPETLEVEVVYALPGLQDLRRLSVAAGTTAGEAVRLSGLLERFAQIDAGHLALGIFGRDIEAAQILSDGDRVEIYRPLQADPKEARRARVQRERRGRR